MLTVLKEMFSPKTDTLSNIQRHLLAIWIVIICEFCIFIINGAFQPWFLGDLGPFNYCIKIMFLKWDHRLEYGTLHRYDVKKYSQTFKRYYLHTHTMEENI